MSGSSSLGEYEITEEDAERLNSVPHRSHSNVKPGEKFPAITSRVSPIMKHYDDDRKPEKVGELHHVHVFFPDRVEVLQISKENPKKAAPKHEATADDETGEGDDE